MTPEHPEQVTFLNWFKARWPNVFIYSTPNAGKRSVWAAAKLKREGMVAGIPDLHVPEWNLWIEMKSVIGGLKKSQKKVIPELRRYDTVIIGQGAEDAFRQVADFVESGRACSQTEMNARQQQAMNLLTDGRLSNAYVRWAVKRSLQGKGHSATEFKQLFPNAPVYRGVQA